MTVHEFRSGTRDRFELRTTVSAVYGAGPSSALGSFRIVVAGVEFGCGEADATMLGCSYDEVERRARDAGKHTMAAFEQASDAFVASAVSAMFGDADDPAYVAPGISARDVYASQVLWAPDGDAAFDDSSYVVQMDCGVQVRIVAFRKTGPAPADFVDLVGVRLSATGFYSSLRDWLQQFDRAMAAIARKPPPA